MSAANEQGLKDCEEYVNNHKIQQVLKECIVQVYEYAMFDVCRSCKVFQAVFFNCFINLVYKK